VVGPAADDIGLQCGGWTIDWQGRPGAVTTGGTTLLAALRHALPAGTVIDFSPDGTDLKSPGAVIVVVGEQPYAEMKGDRPELNLSAADQQRVARARATGAPVVTVLYSGRPMVLGAALDNSDALVAAWLPGTEGEGIADVLLGDCAPTGRLPRVWPADNSQLAVARAANPLFKSGYGLSYELFSRK
jgi:beta-glucosidase